MTTEEKIAELETNCKVKAEEIDKLKAELAEKNETVWIPKCDDSYMYINPLGNVIDTFSRGDNVLDNHRIDFNNVYPSSDKTQKHLEWYCDNVLFVQNKLMQLHELLCPDYFPDWGDDDELKFYLYYNYRHNAWQYNSWWLYCDYVVYFTAEAAEKACEILNREKFMTKGWQHGRIGKRWL